MEKEKFQTQNKEITFKEENQYYKSIKFKSIS